MALHSIDNLSLQLIRANYIAVETNEASDIAALLGVDKGDLGCDDNATFTARGTSASEEFWE